MQPAGQDRGGAERQIAAHLGVELGEGEGAVAGPQRGLDAAVELPAAGRVQRIVGMVEGQPAQQGQQRQLLAHGRGHAVGQQLLVVVDIVGGDADGAERGGGEAAQQIGMHAEISLGIGGGVVAVGGGPELRAVERPGPFREGDLAVDALQDGPVLAVEAHGVGAAEQVEDRQHRVGGDPLAGGVAAAERQTDAGPIGQADDHRPQAIGVRRRRERHVHGVIDPGVEQPSFELGHRLGAVDLARAPGRQAGHPARIGAAGALHLQPVQPDLGLGVDPVGGLDGMVGMVDHHLARIGLGVGIAVLAQGGDQPAFGGDDVGGAPGLARFQPQRSLGVGLGRRIGRRAGPDHLGTGDDRAGSRIDAQQRPRRVAIADVGGHRIVVVAFRPKHDDGVVGGGLGALARLEAAVRRALAGPDVALDRLAQGFVLHALDAGAHLIGQAWPGDSRGYSENGRGRPQAKSSHAAIPCFAPAVC